ncbi:MAG: hypothetical protein M0Z66_14010 [Thermaerobacter sp.]|nr:hypothetical protein [Thermaerobacter sp.]
MAQEFRALGLPSLDPGGAFDGDRWQRTLAKEVNRPTAPRAARRWVAWTLTVSGLAATLFFVSLFPSFRPPTAYAVARAILNLHNFSATIRVQQRNALGQTAHTGNKPWLTDPVATAQVWADGRTHATLPTSGSRAIVQVTAPQTSVVRIYLA